LDLRAAGLGVVAEFLGCEGRPVDPVPSRASAHGHERISHSLGFTLDEVLSLEQPEAHGVDDWIAFIPPVERDLTADVGDAHAVPVVTDSFDDTGEEVTDAPTVEITESKRI